jgi:Ca2+-binding EF-hand superfamily protein
MSSNKKEIPEKYQNLFNFFSQEHSLNLTIDEMNEIIFEVGRLKQNSTTVKTGDYCAVCGSQEFYNDEHEWL